MKLTSAPMVRRSHRPGRAVAIALAVGLVGLGAVNALIAPSPAAAVTTAVQLLECTTDGANSTRGVDICYEASSRINGKELELFYDVMYEYRSNPAELPAIRIRQLFQDGEGLVSRGLPTAGDRASLHIVYPAITTDVYVGKALANATFVLVQAEDFDYTKRFVDVNGDDPDAASAVGIRYDFDFTFVAVSFRDGCGFDDFLSGFPFTAKPECESENGAGDGDTEDFVSDTISFDPSNPDFQPEYVDGGFINFHAQSGLTIVSDGSQGLPSGVYWQIVGPKFAQDDGPNTGTAQVFISAAHREFVFGADFEVDGTAGIAVDRSDRQGAEEAVTVSVLNDVVVTERRGGLLITVEEYEFSAPQFSITATEERDETTTAAGSPIAVTCEGTRAVGSAVTCTITGGDPGIDILWRAAYNPSFAGEGVTLDASGSGTFSFVVPAAALGEELTVELVEWIAPVTLGTVGGPVPTSVPSGGGPVPTWPVLVVALAGVVVLRSGSRLRWPVVRVRGV